MAVSEVSVMEGEPEAEMREMLTAEQVLMMIPISRTTLFRLEEDKLFPQGIPVTTHRKLWFKHEVIQWQRELKDPDSAVCTAMRDRAHRGNQKKRRHREAE